MSNYFTEEYNALKTTNKISVLENELNKQYNNKSIEQQNALYNNEVLQNTFNSLYDGLKIVSSAEDAIPFKAPMICIANAFYKTTENDGLKDIVKIYVCMPQDGSKTPTVTDENFKDYMVDWDMDE